MSLPAFDRALVVVAPHGGHIVSGRKKVLIKSKHYKMESEKLLVVEKKTAIGVITVGPPRTIGGIPRFRALRPQHLVTEEERRRWWPHKQTFYVYPITSVRRIKPIRVQYPQGAQVFVQKRNIKKA